MFGCFPVSVQFPNEERDRQSPQYDFLADLAQSATSFVQKQIKQLSAARQRRSVKANVAPVAANRRELAATTTDARLIAVFSHDADAAVRTALIYNPSVSADVLYLLAQDENRFVAAQARARFGQLAA